MYSMRINVLIFISKKISPTTFRKMVFFFFRAYLCVLFIQRMRTMLLVRYSLWWKKMLTMRTLCNRVTMLSVISIFYLLHIVYAPSPPPPPHARICRIASHVLCLPKGWIFKMHSIKNNSEPEPFRIRAHLCQINIL